MQKANAEAAGHAAKAKQAARSGLKNLTSQAGAALGAMLTETPSSCHPGAGRGPEAGRTKEANDRAVSTFQKWQAMGCR